MVPDGIRRVFNEVDYFGLNFYFTISIKEDAIDTFLKGEGSAALFW